MAQLATTPYVQFHKPDSKEYHELLTRATLLFKPAKEYDLNPNNSPQIAETLEEYGKTFGYNLLTKRFPTERVQTVDKDGNPTGFAYGGHANMVKSWNLVTKEQVRSFASDTWGDKTYSVPASNVIVPLSAARGELTSSGNFTAAGKKLHLRRMQSSIMGAQIMKLFKSDARKTIKLNEKLFEWFNDDTGESVIDGPFPLLLHLQNSASSCRT